MTNVWLLVQRDLDGTYGVLCVCPDEATAESLRGRFQAEAGDGVRLHVELVPVMYG